MSRQDILLLSSLKLKYKHLGSPWQPDAGERDGHYLTYTHKVGNPAIRI